MGNNQQYFTYEEKRLNIFFKNTACRLWLHVLYCIVVGSRRLMPPDALQPKAYCTNHGL